MLFRSASMEEVRASAMASMVNYTDKSIPELRRAIISRLKPYRTAYKSGQAMLAYLYRKAAESNESFNSRSKNFFDKPLSAVIVDEHSRFAYSRPPKREWWVGADKPNRMAQTRAILRGETVQQDKTSQALAEWFTDIYDLNLHRQLFLRGAKLKHRDGLAALKTYVDQGMEYGDDYLNPTGPVRGVRMDFMGDFGDGPMDLGFGYEDAIPILDPSDVDRVIGVIETRRPGNEEEYFIWSGVDVQKVGANFDPKSDAVPHGYGRPPFVYFGDKQSILVRVFDYQKALDNAASALNAGVRFVSGFPVPVFKGSAPPPQNEQTIDGQPATRVAHDEMVVTEKDGDFGFVSAQFDIAGVQSYIDSTLREAFQMGYLPESIISGDVGAVQPMTLAQLLIPTEGQYRENVAQFTSAEDETIWLLARIGFDNAAEFGLGGGWQVPETPHQSGNNFLDWDVTFAKSPMPQNDKEDRARDAADVASGLMLIEDFVGTWILPDGSPQEIADYVQALGKAKQSTAVMPNFPPLTGGLPNG